MTKEQLEKKYGRVWTTKELQEDFIVHSFLAPYAYVTRKCDGVNGTIMFISKPRFYYNFVQLSGKLLYLDP